MESRKVYHAYKNHYNFSQNEEQKDFEGEYYLQQTI